MNEHGSVQVRLWDGQGILVCVWAKSILRLFHMILVLGGCHFCGGHLLLCLGAGSEKSFLLNPLRFSLPHPTYI